MEKLLPNMLRLKTTQKMHQQKEKDFERIGIALKIKKIKFIRVRFD